MGRPIGSLGLLDGRLGRLRLRLQQVRILRVEEDLYVAIFDRGRRHLAHASQLEFPVVGDLLQEHLPYLREAHILLRELEVERDLLRGVEHLTEHAHLIEVGILDELVDTGAIERVELQHAGQQSK